MINNKRNTVILLTAGMFATELLWKLLNNFIASRRKKTNPIEEMKNELIMEVFFFSEESQLCRNEAITRIPCEKECCTVKNLKRIEWYMNSATKTLDVCMYLMSYNHLTELIISAHKRGVVVRVIVDAGMSENAACNRQLLHILRAGIHIRMNRLRASSLMHHKFAIIDRRIGVIGSTNWTMQAFFGNFDSILVTNVEKCITPYAQHFDELWLNFEST